MPRIKVSQWPAARSDTDVISVPDEWPHDARDIARANGWFDNWTGEISRCEVRFNRGSRLAVLDANDPSMPKRTYDLQSIMTHEFRHTLGLNESLDEHAVMFIDGHRNDVSNRVSDR